jgi:Flp pilus assembly protein TadG
MSNTKHQNKREKGYFTLTVALSITAILAAAGLAIDLGRIFYVKSELQNFSDSASIFATMQLDGTSAGITNAQAAVTQVQGIMKWDFETKTVDTSNITVLFAQGQAQNPSVPDDTTWTANPNDPSYYRFAKVTAAAPVPLSFMAALNTLQGGGGGAYNGSSMLNYMATGYVGVLGSTFNVSATSAGGQQLITTYPVGLLPFSPVAWAPTTPDDFGLNAGTVYTLRYPSQGGQKKGSVCAGDTNAPWIGNLPSQDRGYWGSTSAAALRGEIIDDSEIQPLAVGQVVPMVGGNKNTEGSALAARIAEDSDTVSSTFTAYLSGQNGNGRRIVGVPINSGPTVVAPYTQPFTAVGIGAFFLLTADNYTSVTGSDPICAEYIGPFVQGMLRGGAGQTASAGSTGGYIARLIQ